MAKMAMFPSKNLNILKPAFLAGAFLLLAAVDLFSTSAAVSWVDKVLFSPGGYEVTWQILIATVLAVVVMVDAWK